MSTDGRYILLDQASMNELGEFDTFAEAEACFLRFVKAEPTAVEHLEIWDDDEDIPNHSSSRSRARPRSPAPAVRAAQTIVWPPSTMRSWPVM